MLRHARLEDWLARAGGPSLPRMPQEVVQLVGLYVGISVPTRDWEPEPAAAGDWACPSNSDQFQRYYHDLEREYGWDLDSDTAYACWSRTEHGELTWDGWTAAEWHAWRFECHVAEWNLWERRLDGDSDDDRWSTTGEPEQPEPTIFVRAWDWMRRHLGGLHPEHWELHGMPC